MRTENRLTVFNLPDGTIITTRSALEARWAIFFTELGLKWNYEPISFDHYTPDFRVEDIGLIEIKPTLELFINESSEKIKWIAGNYPTEKIFAFIGGRVSLDLVAMYQGDKIYAPTYQQMMLLIQKVAVRCILLPDVPEYMQAAMNHANSAKLDHFVSVAKITELQRILPREETARFKEQFK